MRAVLADGVTDYNWTEKGREVCGLFSAYGDREFQGEVLYRTKLRGEDGISFYFDDGYTYFPWPSLANLLDALIEAGAYPDITAEKEPDPIGDYNIPAEVEEMGGAPQREIGQADYDYVWVLWLMKQVKRRKNPSARKRYLQKSRESQRRMK